MTSDERKDRPARSGDRPHRKRETSNFGDKSGDGHKPRDGRKGRDGDRNVPKWPTQKDKPAEETAEEAQIRLARQAEDKRQIMESRMPGMASRRAAVDVLALMRKGRSLDEALAQCRSFGVLEGPDRAFARHMVSSSWRRRGAIDGVIGAYLDRPLPGKSVEVMDLLRLATVQLLILETPAHAAVATATELASQKQETRGYAKLVNAIARRISEKGKSQFEAQKLRVDTPGWLWRALERAYGPAKVEAIARANGGEAAFDLTLKPGTEPEALMAIEGATSLLPGHVRLPAGQDAAALPGYETGEWWVQDLAASLPVRLLGDVSGKAVIDLCAAPGGKTLQLIAGGASVSAVDISGFRLKRLMENLERTGLEAVTVKADVMEWAPGEPADVVLLDAPCTATGTIRRNPDVAWAKSEEDVKHLALLQSRMIDKALTFLKPGGTLVYCVCSLLRAEGEDQVKAALERNEGLTLEPIDPASLPGLEASITREGTLRTLPSMLADKGGMDGFFAAVLRKPS